jgi:hypothetical protein
MLRRQTYHEHIKSHPKLYVYVDVDVDVHVHVHVTVLPTVNRPMKLLSYSPIWDRLVQHITG